jgi:DNA-binding GntR family transcriptional regulator
MMSSSRSRLTGLLAMNDGPASEHLAVAEAIKRGDGAHAENVMREHVRNAKQRFLALPDTDFG